MLHAQEKPPADREIKGAVIAGLNLSQVDGDEVYGFSKAGITAGFGGILPLGKRFSFSAEILYDQRGAYSKYPPSPDSTAPPYYQLKLDYLSVPLLIQYEDRNTWTFGAGLQWGRLVSYKETERGIQKNWDEPHILYATRNDFSVLADIRFRLYKHLKFNARYSYSLAKIRTREFTNNLGDTWTRNQFNNVITLRLVYLFNEKYLPPREKIPRKNKDKKKKKTDNDTG